MGRSSLGEFRTTVHHSIGWGSNADLSASLFDQDSEDVAVQCAIGLVDQMRREGSASTIRHVEVRQRGDWDRDKLTHSCPPIFQASYYDPEQGLTDTETYAARVHDWHAVVDRFNANYVRNNSIYRTGYAPWIADWGTKPIECPACGADVTVSVDAGRSSVVGEGRS